MTTPAAQASGLIPDDVLATCIQNTMSSVYSHPSTGAAGEITQADIDFLNTQSTVSIDCSGGPAGQVSDLTDLDRLAGVLVGLQLDNNLITDVSPLAGLTRLGWLDLSFNQITDVTPLAGMTVDSLGLGLNLSGNQLTDIAQLNGLPLNTGGGLQLDDNQISDLTVLTTPQPLCTQAQSVDLDAYGPMSQYAGQCVRFEAVFQRLTGSAVAGSPVALPTVVGQPDDPVLWSVMQGAAVINVDGTVTYPAAGTYVLQFQDIAPWSGYIELVSSNLPDEATCTLQAGQWVADAAMPGGYGCQITSVEFSGIVIVTVTAAPAPGTSVDAGGTVATSPLLPLASLLVMAGLVMALRARRTS